MSDQLHGVDLHPDHPRQFHLYRQVHLFYNIHYLGMVDVPGGEIILHPDFEAFSEDAIDWVGRVKHVKLPVRLSDEEKKAPKPLEEFPDHIKLRMAGPIDPEKGAMSPSAGDMHPDAIRWALDHFSKAEFERRYGTRSIKVGDKTRRMTIAAAEALLKEMEHKRQEEATEAERLELEPEPIAEDDRMPVQSPEETETVEVTEINPAPWDEDLDGPAPEVFRCCVTDKEYPMEQWGGRAPQMNDLPVCREVAEAVLGDGGPTEETE